MKNRFMVSPLTNLQSNPDGTLSDDEERFGLTMTCASHVDPRGQGFPGQLGCFSDDHLPGLTRLAAGIRAQ
jgi:2,4-dienoyl-CoA reductase-like NADH-dependent reductase (Old Yellow Enzyme family)